MKIQAWRPRTKILGTDKELDTPCKVKEGYLMMRNDLDFTFIFATWVLLSGEIDKILGSLQTRPRMNNKKGRYRNIQLTAISLQPFELKF